MSGPLSVLATVEARLSEYGLCARGLVRFAPEDVAPRLVDGRRAAAVLAIGVTGGAMWPHFERWRMAQADRGGVDPLDRWSKIVIDALADAVGGASLLSLGSTLPPLPGLGDAAEGLKPSPLGILIHPRYGLWHSYRGALLFATWDGDALSSGPRGLHPCDTCRRSPVSRHARSARFCRRVSISRVAPAPGQRGRAGGLHAFGLSGAQCLSGRWRLPLSRGAIAVSHAGRSNFGMRLQLMPGI